MGKKIRSVPFWDGNTSYNLTMKKLLPLEEIAGMIFMHYFLFKCIGTFIRLYHFNYFGKILALSLFKRRYRFLSHPSNII